jgi:hypothetical protein
MRWIANTRGLLGLGLAVVLLLAISVAPAFAARAADPGELASFAAVSQDQPACLDAQVSTVDPTWAAARYPRRSGCPPYMVGVVKVFRYTDGAWTVNGSFEPPSYCPTDQAPAAVARDLALCRTPQRFEYVLGTRGWAGDYGRGWGMRRPRTLYNGGAPSGLIKHILWHHWGSRVASGQGITYVYKPGGGYYDRPGRIKLRADRRGVCGDKPAYQRLRVSVEQRPGSGRYGHWVNWSGASDLCDLSFWG